jgi:hypothetical protein
MKFFPGEYDAGASSASTCGRTTQRLRTNSEPRTRAGTADLWQLIETEKGKITRVDKNEHA